MSGFANRRSAATASPGNRLHGDAAIAPDTPAESTWSLAQPIVQRRPTGETGVPADRAAVPSGIVQGIPSGGREAANAAVPSGIVSPADGGAVLSGRDRPALASMHRAAPGTGDATANAAIERDRGLDRRGASTSRGGDATDELSRRLEEMRLGDASSSRRSDAAVLSAEDCRWLEELDELRKAGAGQAAGVGLTSLVSMRIDKLGVRRGEPGAAEKRALIGAQRSVHPETLAMIDLFAISRAEDEALRRQRGLHDPKSTEQFAHDMRSLGGRWGAMSAAERADAIGRRINARLGDIEVPAVKIKTLDLGPSNGHFDFRDWSVAVNAQRLDAPVIGSDLLGGVTNTIYHEARHAEQWYLMARLMAARRMSPDEIARTATIPLPVAEAAAHAPPLSRAQASAAQLFYNSVYGVHAAHRDQVNHQLGHLNTALTVAGRAFEESVVNPFMSPVEKQQKASEFYYLQHLHAQWNNAYLALPEEQDAWAAGHAAERAYQYSLTGPPPRG